MSTRESGKQRAQRIQLNYFRRGNLSQNPKFWWSVIPFALGLAVVGYCAVDGGGSISNPGPLISGHANLEDNCSVCHQAFTPIGGDSVRDCSILGISHADSVAHTKEVCSSCHQNIGGHFQASMADPWPLVDDNCAVCHADHQGRDFNLAAVTSRQCVQCHSQLDQVCQADRQTVQRTGEITSYTSFSASSHGDFHSLMTAGQDGDPDPGTIKFDHAQHLLPGQSANGKDVIRLSDLSPEKRAIYRSGMEKLKQSNPAMADLDTSDQALVQLDCASCHVMGDSPAESLALLSDADLGRYMKPISFDQHCAACHTMNPAGRTADTLPIPHAATWTEMDQWVQVKLAATPDNDPGNPLGIGAVDSDSSDADSQSTARQQAISAWQSSATVEQARAVLRSQCAKCHDEALYQSDETILAAKQPGADPLIPQRWLQHGIYDHAAHRNIDCRFCHGEVDAGSPADPASDQNRVIIAGIESCVGCHRDNETPIPSELEQKANEFHLFSGQMTAPNNCTLCHRYHERAAGHAELAVSDSGGSP